jgi:Pectate lyase superfamily protein
VAAKVYGTAERVDWLNAVTMFGADPTGATDSAPAIQDALSAAPAGQVVYIPDGTYMLSGPLTPPPGVQIVMGLAGYDPAAWGDAASGAVLKPAASFSGAAVFLFGDVSNALTQGPSIYGGAIDGSALVATVDGIRATGPVSATVLRDFFIAGVTGVGINCVIDSSASGNQYPYGWHCYHVRIHNTGQQGIVLPNHSDATWIDVHTLGTTGHGWSIPAPCPNSRFVGCKAEWTGAGKDGFHLSGTWGSGTGSGGMVFTGCSTDRNDNNGFYCSAAGDVPILITGCMFRRDGRNGGSGGGGYAGINLAGSALPVIIGPVTVWPGVDDNGSGASSPQYGLALGAGTANVDVRSGYIQGVSAPITSGTGLANVNIDPRAMLASGASSSPALTSQPQSTAIAAEVDVTNTTTETTVVSLALPGGLLAAGSTWRISARGTIQVAATSGTLTFRPYIGGTAAAQAAQMASQGSAGGPVSFWAEFLVTVRTAGSSGTYLAHGAGEIELPSRVNLSTSSLATAAVDTTAAAPVIKLTAQWAAASASNALAVSIASISRVS